MLIDRHSVMSLLLIFWKKSNLGILPDEEIITFAQMAKKNLATMSVFFDEVGRAVNNANGNDSLVVSARTTMADIRIRMTALDRALTDAQSDLTNAEDAFRVATSERLLKEAPAESEDIRIAATKVEEARSQLAIVRDNIARATLRAPYSGMIVKKIFHKRKEVVLGGDPVALLAMPVLKMRADVSEEDVVNVTIGAPAGIFLKAYRGRSLLGKVVLIEPSEVIKNESTYFRTDLFFDDIPADMLLRSGMTGDVTIETGQMRPALFLPKNTLTYKDGRYTAMIKEDGKLVIIPVTLGEEIGNDVEVIGALNRETEVMTEN